MYSTVYHGTISYYDMVLELFIEPKMSGALTHGILYYTHTHTHITHTEIACHDHKKF